MTKFNQLLLAASFSLLPAIVEGQALDPAILTKPLGDSWATYSGDYSGKRYSSLKQVNQSTVKNLSLSWVSRFTTGCGPTGAGDAGGGGGGFGGRGGGGAPVPIIAGGLGKGDLNNCGAPRLGGGRLLGGCGDVHVPAG